MLDPHPAVRPTRSKSVLLVDDDAAMRRALTHTLQHAGYTVTIATDGAAALRLMAIGPAIDLLVVDIFMPERDGFDVLDVVRRSPSPLPVLAISGGGVSTQGDEALHQAQLLGARAVLAKPFAPEDFLAAVARILEGDS